MSNHANLVADPISSWQDLFVKRCEKTTTETEREKNVVSVGWFSKEDLKHQLKWNPNLGLIPFNYMLATHYRKLLEWCIHGCPFLFGHKNAEEKN